MKENRKLKRYKKVCKTAFVSKNVIFKGTASDFSLNGLFIRTNHAFAPGSILDITIHLPDGITSQLKGKVMRAHKTPVVTMKNGMGVLLLEKDADYIEFMKIYDPDIKEEPTTGKFRSESESQTEARTPPESKPPDPADFLLLACGQCGVKNKVHKSKIAQGPKCGKCKSSLVISLG